MNPQITSNKSPEKHSKAEGLGVAQRLDTVSSAVDRVAGSQLTVEAFPQPVVQSQAVSQSFEVERHQAELLAQQQVVEEAERLLREAANDHRSDNLKDAEQAVAEALANAPSLNETI